MAVFLLILILAGCRPAAPVAWASESRSVFSFRWPAASYPQEDDVLRLQKSRGLTHYIVGLLAEGRGDLKTAQAAYQQAQSYDPNRLAVTLRLGATYLRNDDFDRAAEMFNEAARLDPTDFRPRFLLGVLYAAQNKLEESAEQYRQVLAQDPGHLGALSHLADLYILQEKLQDGMNVYERFLQERPDAPVAHFNLAVLYARSERWQEAVAHFRKTLELDPANIEARLGFGVSLEQAGDLKSAKRELLEALQLEPQHTQLIHYLAQLSGRLGEYDEAAHWLERYLSFNPHEPSAHLELGLVYEEAGDYLKAEQAFQQAIGLSSESADRPYLYLAALYYRLGRYADAESIYQQALKENPDDPVILNGLGFLYAEWGQHLEQAALLLTRAIAQDPQNGAYLDSLGWIYFKLGEKEKALALLRQASQRLDDSEIWEHLGAVYLSLAQMTKAQEAWEHALALKPKDSKLVERLQEDLKHFKRRKE